VGLLLNYLAIHLTLFAKVLITDCKGKCRARCYKDKPKQPVVVTPKANANEVAVAPQVAEAPVIRVAVKQMERRGWKQKKREKQLSRSAFDKTTYELE